MVEAPAVPGGDAPPFYVPIGEFQGDLYRRNAFAAHTAAEIDALARGLGLVPGDRVLDVGCGDGRHLRELATRGIGGHGIDAAPALVVAASAHDTPEVTFAVGDARHLDVPAASFDVAWALCQGGFGTSPVTDPDVVRGLARAVRPGGHVVWTAFHTLFAVRHLAPGDAYDPVSQVHHQTSEVRGPDDRRRVFDLWTASYTVRDVARLVDELGLELVSVTGCEPGRYDGTAVGLDDPELLVVARNPSACVDVTPDP